MIQGTDGISLAHRAAQRCLAVARQLSVVALVVSIAALLAGTAGTSYAQGRKVSREDRTIEDTVVVSNFGSLFAGSVETFTAGSAGNIHAAREIKGSSTLLGAGNGASGDAQSALDGDIAVTIALGVPVLCPAGCVGVWPAGATGNSAPEDFIGGPAGVTGGTVPLGPLVFDILSNNTGLFLDQGVAFNNPFRYVGVHNVASVTQPDQFAVANFGQVVVASVEDVGDIGTCFGAAFEQPNPTIGTITEYFSGDTGNVAPTPNVPVFEAAFPPSTALLFSNATIGGCSTGLDGPVGVAFDDLGELFVVNEGLAGVGVGPPGFVTVYQSGAFGDAPPFAIIGLVGPTAAAFINPLYIAVSPDGDTMYVTDAGDNSIKVFDTFSNFNGLFFEGTQLGTIAGGKTKLVRPEGIAFNGFDDLYVVNNNANSLEMFDDLDLSGLGNNRAKTIIKGKKTNLNFPVGVALPPLFSAD